MKSLYKVSNWFSRCRCYTISAMKMINVPRWWPWSDHVIFIARHHRLSLALDSLLHIALYNLISTKNRSPDDFMEFRPGWSGGIRLHNPSLWKYPVFLWWLDNDKNSKNVQIKSPLKKFCFNNSSYNSSTERQGDYLSTGYFICRRSYETA